MSLQCFYSVAAMNLKLDYCSSVCKKPYKYPRSPIVLLYRYRVLEYTKRQKNVGALAKRTFRELQLKKIIFFGACDCVFDFTKSSSMKLVHGITEKIVGFFLVTG